MSFEIINNLVMPQVILKKISIISTKYIFLIINEVTTGLIL